MANFRSGFLKQGSPLGTLKKSKTAYASDIVSGDIWIDTQEVKRIELSGVKKELAISGTSTGAGPYDVVATLSDSKTSQYKVGDVIVITNASGWTSSSAFEHTHTITEIGTGTVTFQVATDPGASGTFDLKLDPSSRDVRILDGKLEGQEVLIVNVVDSVYKITDGVGNLRLIADWEPQGQYDSIKVMWDGTYWIEVSRSEHLSNIHNRYSYATGTLTQAQILALNTSPVELIAAPGANSYIVVDSITMNHKYATAAYATNTNLVFRYGDGTNIFEDNGILASTTTNIYYNKPNYYDVDSSLAVTIVAINDRLNESIEFFASTGDPTAGDADNIIEYEIRFQVISFDF